MSYFGNTIKNNKEQIKSQLMNESYADAIGQGGPCNPGGTI